MTSFWAIGQSRFRPMELIVERQSALGLKEPGKLLHHYRFPSFRLSNDAEMVCEAV